MPDSDAPRRYVAFLRAVNVGGRTVKMDQLRALFVASGFAEVETFIASGNVIFHTEEIDPRTLERRIEALLADALGYAVETFVRPIGDLARIASHEPFPAAELAAERTQLDIGFLPAPPGAGAHAAVMALASEVEEFRIHETELYWLRRRARGDSRVSGPQLAKALGMPTTIRTANTVRRLAAKYAR